MEDMKEDDTYLRKQYSKTISHKKNENNSKI